MATSGYDQPILPPYASAIAPVVMQLHSVDYRRPSQLPAGATLIVGTGQSGEQIMENLHLAVGPASRSARKYRGRDATDWLHDMGHNAITTDRHPDPLKALTQTNHYMSGRDGGKEIDLRPFALEGVRLYGSLAGAEGPHLRFLPNLEKNLDDADRSYCGIRDQIDSWIAAQGINAPQESPFQKVWRPEAEVTQTDCTALGITSILWAIGFRPDYRWLEVGCFDAHVRPAYRRDVTDVPGIYFIGLGWLNT